MATIQMTAQEIDAIIDPTSHQRLVKKNTDVYKAIQAAYGAMVANDAPESEKIIHLAEVRSTKKSHCVDGNHNLAAALETGFTGIFDVKIHNLEDEDAVARKILELNNTKQFPGAKKFALVSGTQELAEKIGKILVKIGLIKGYADEKQEGKIPLMILAEIYLSFLLKEVVDKSYPVIANMLLKHGVDKNNFTEFAAHMSKLVRIRSLLSPKIQHKILETPVLIGFASSPTLNKIKSDIQRSTMAVNFNKMHNNNKSSGGHDRHGYWKNKFTEASL